MRTPRDIRCGWYTVAAVVAYVACMVAVFVVPPEWLQTYGNIAALLGAVAGTYFVLGSLRYSRWRESEEGVHLLVFSSVLVVALWWIFVSRFAFAQSTAPVVGDRLVQLTFGVCVYVSLFYLLLWRAVIFTRVQMTARRKLKHKGDSAIQVHRP